MNMTFPGPDKVVANFFGLEIDGVQIRPISEVSGLKMEQDVIELRQNSAEVKYVIKKLPGQVTLTRSLTEDNSFEQWVKDIRSGKMGEAHKDAHIIVFDDEGGPIKRYRLANCWPKSLELATMRAGDSTVLTEKLVVTYESLDPE